MLIMAHGGDNISTRRQDIATVVAMSERTIGERSRLSSDRHAHPPERN